MTRPRTLVPFLVPFFCACATAGGTFAPLGPEHPASAAAPEVAIADPSALLRAQAASFGASPAESTQLEHATGAYVCPMHPEVASDEPGRCPKCNMKLVARAELEDGEHDHDD